MQTKFKVRNFLHKRKKLSVLRRGVKFILILVILCLLPSFIFFDSQPEESNRASASTQAEIDALNAQIKSKEQEVNNLKSKQKEYEKIISDKQEEIQSLEGQIALFQDQIKAIQDKINLTELEIETTALQIDKLTKEIAEKETEIENQKETISELLRTIYEISQFSSMEVLIANGKLSDFVNTVTYVSDIQSTLESQLENVKALKADLESQQSEMEDKKAELDELHNELSGQKSNLDAQKAAKQTLLAQTRASEQEYKKIKDQAEREENRILNESIPVLQEKIKELSVPPSSGYFINPLKTNTCITSDFWGLRCFYSDGVCRRHYGVDINTYQGQTLYAAADGIVIKIQPSCSHRYIVIQHTDANLVSIYMHLSQIGVSQGSTVTKGQYIGNTGGTVGTCGAGTSTGPHLHFEVRDLTKSCGSSCRYWSELGKPVDPKQFTDLGSSCY
jgi:murein DD-endopeptidase MepM/ murein hydrolase activator NlpD